MSPTCLYCCTFLKRTRCKGWLQCDNLGLIFVYLVNILQIRNCDLGTWKRCYNKIQRYNKQLTDVAKVYNRPVYLKMKLKGSPIKTRLCYVIVCVQLWNYEKSSWSRFNQVPGDFSRKACVQFGRLVTRQIMLIIKCLKNNVFAYKIRKI